MLTNFITTILKIHITILSPIENPKEFIGPISNSNKYVQSFFTMIPDVICICSSMMDGVTIILPWLPKQHVHSKHENHIIYHFILISSNSE